LAKEATIKKTKPLATPSNSFLSGQIEGGKTTVQTLQNEIERRRQDAESRNGKQRITNG
jgi:hypothetical protein